MLVEQTLFGATDKVADAIKLLREHEPPEGYYLCFSGGKDSVVIHDLAVRAGVKFGAYHNITTVEPPELMKFIRDYYPDVINDHPPLSMYQLIVKKKFPPLRLARYCCAELKERGGRGRVKVTGIRSEESPRRAKRKQIADYYRRACRKSFEVNTFNKGWKSGDDMFDWWIESRKYTRIADDCNSVPLFSEDDGSVL